MTADASDWYRVVSSLSRVKTFKVSISIVPFDRGDDDYVNFNFIGIYSGRRKRGENFLFCNQFWLLLSAWEKLFSRRFILHRSSARAILYLFLHSFYRTFHGDELSYFTPWNWKFSSFLLLGFIESFSFHATPPSECFLSFVMRKLKNPHQQETFTYHDKNFSRGNEKGKLHDEANKNCNELVSNTAREAYENNWTANNKVWLKHDPSERRENRFGGRKIGCRFEFSLLMCCFESVEQKEDTQQGMRRQPCFGKMYSSVSGVVKVTLNNNLTVVNGLELSLLLIACAWLMIDLSSSSWAHL